MFNAQNTPALPQYYGCEQVCELTTDKALAKALLFTFVYLPPTLMQ